MTDYENLEPQMNFLEEKHHLTIQEELLVDIHLAECEHKEGKQKFTQHMLQLVDEERYEEAAEARDALIEEEEEHNKRIAQMVKEAEQQKIKDIYTWVYGSKKEKETLEAAYQDWYHTHENDDRDGYIGPVDSDDGWFDID